MCTSAIEINSVQVDEEDLAELRAQQVKKTCACGADCPAKQGKQECCQLK